MRMICNWQLNVMMKLIMRLVGSAFCLTWGAVTMYVCIILAHCMFSLSADMQYSVQLIYIMHVQFALCKTNDILDIKNVSGHIVKNNPLHMHVNI